MDSRRFYENTQGSPAVPSLLHALDHWQQMPGQAIDLGCGSGRDTMELLRNGWQVTAIDHDPIAFEYLNALALPKYEQVLRCECAPFQDIDLPPADLINASFSLPFCPPGEFASLWQRVEHAIKPGGLFAGHFFGERDSWAREGLAIHTRADVETLFQGWKLIGLKEIDGQGPTAVGRSKHWHRFAVVARHLG